VAQRQAARHRYSPPHPGFYVSANGTEKKGDWHDGKRICWLDEKGNKLPGDGASDADIDV
jgi:hypothetical protein